MSPYGREYGLNFVIPGKIDWFQNFKETSEAKETKEYLNSDESSETYQMEDDDEYYHKLPIKIGEKRLVIISSTFEII